MFIENLQKDPQFFFAVIITVVFSVCIHELAHGIAAIWLGDRTPIETGHMTLNPVVHMGPQSLIMLAFAGIAWGQMPVNRSRLRGRFGGTWVALAGPASNVLLALAALTALGLSERFASPYFDPSKFTANLRELLWVFGYTNVALAIFNLIPVPPLDGSNALAGLNPQFAEIMMRVRAGGQAMMIFIILFIFGSPYIFDGAAILSRHYLYFIRGA